MQRRDRAGLSAGSLLCAHVLCVVGECKIGRPITALGGVYVLFISVMMCIDSRRLRL